MKHESIIKIMLISLTIMLSFSARAQSVKFKAFAERIKYSGEYYWGEASADEDENIRVVESDALGRLLNQIAVNVSSVFQHKIKETGEDLNESVSKILKTYSTASLQNVEGKIENYDGKIYVIKYIKKSVVNNIFQKRKKLIYDLYTNAQNSEKNFNHGIALKYYYFSIILMNSIPEQNIIWNGINLKTEAPKKINEILNDINFRLISDNIKSDKERILTYAVTVKGKPTNNLQFQFSDGNDFIDGCIKDGAVNIVLFSGSAELTKLNIKIKYDYYSDREEIKEVGELWNLVNRPKFRAARITVSAAKIVEIKPKEMPRQLFASPEKNGNFTEVINNGKFTLNLNNADSCKITDKIGKEALIYLELLELNDSEKIKEFLQGDSFMINKTFDILRYNKIKIIDKEINADINKTRDGYEIRKIRTLNKYYSLNKQTTEYMILDFDKNGKIYDVNFGIMESIYDEFVKQAKFGNDWGNRQVIIKFMEKYRTAYLTRDISTLDKIFAEDALIIIGRMIKKKKNNDMVRYIKLNDSQPSFEQIKLTKANYLKRQKRIFKSNEDIFLDFSKFNILSKNKQKGVYGISLRQGYQSTGYSDEGYLFLLIDFNKKNPQIYVRSWQPQEWDSVSLIGLSNFKINK